MPSHRAPTAPSEPEPEPAIHGWLTVDLVHDHGDWSRLVDAAPAAIDAAMRALASHQTFATRPSAEVCIALSDDAAVRQLNATYRAKDKPTNVLSFPAGDEAQEPGRNIVFLGDVVIALETVLDEAANLEIAARHHLQHLAIHGVLHLAGFDHETEADAAVMEGLETEILAGLGIPNPYNSGFVLESATSA